MAHPICVVELAVRSFLDQWFRGMQPSLNLFTQPNGVICVSNSVASPPPIHHRQKDLPYRQKRGSRSGYNSRIRRQSKRAYCQSQIDGSPPTSSSSTLKCVPNESQVDQSHSDNSSFQADVAVQAVAELTDSACQAVPFKCLSVIKNSSISINPRPIFHPAIINASIAFYKKHPSDLTPEELEKFKFYLKWKREGGEPVETDIVYLPSSMRNCLHCGHPT